jgi:hypothetical protein
MKNKGDNLKLRDIIILNKAKKVCLKLMGQFYTILSMQNGLTNGGFLLKKTVHYQMKLIIQILELLF